MQSESEVHKWKKTEEGMKGVKVKLPLFQVFPNDRPVANIGLMSLVSEECMLWLYGQKSNWREGA